MTDRVVSWRTLAGFVATLGLLFFAFGCGPCEDQQKAVEAACKADPDSQACADALEALKVCILPTPTPTPSPSPTVEPTPSPTPTPPEPTPTPSPTPSPAGCVLAGEPTAALPGYRSTLGSQVNAAMLALKPECGYAGGTCLLGDETQQGWQARVEAELRRRGVCAGQHSPGTDEIAASRVATDPWEGYHVFAGDASPGPVPPGGARRTVVWHPQAYRDAWVSPVLVGCGAPVPAAAGQLGGLGKIAAKPHTTRRFSGVCGTAGDVLRLIDATPQIYAGKSYEIPPPTNYCAKIGSFVPGTTSGNTWCPARLEGNAQRFACEILALGGRMTWQASGPGACVATNPDNSFQAACTGAGCQLRACNADGSLCSDWVQP